MNSIIISLYEAYPPASGCANVTYNFSKYLLGNKYLFQFCCKEGVEIHNNNLKIINYRLPSHKRFIKLMIIKRKLSELIEKIKEINPDYIFLEGASGAILLLYVFEYLRDKGIKSTFIYHSHNVEHELRKQKEIGLITLLTRIAEGRLLEKVDYMTAVSEEDILKFKKLYGKTPYLLPNGVDINSFENVTIKEISNIKSKYNLKGKVLFYMGLPDYRSNREAICFLDEKVMPKIVMDYPELKLAIIGGKVGFERPWLINPGSIPYQEVPAFIKSSDICLAPIFSGSGTRLKILEYMAAGKPVISTTKGAEGLAVKNGDNILIADDTNLFIEKIIYILEHTKFAEEIGNEGMEIIKKRYSWKNIMQSYNETLYD
jgi:glycosyltransferase involved in cell wall biosynthesis